MSITIRVIQSELLLLVLITKSLQDSVTPAEVVIQKQIDSVVSFVKQLTEGGDGDWDPECINNRNRDPKQDASSFSDNNEAVSFILSIEPVHENVQEILNETQDLVTDPRNPKAIFVMLPNFDKSELNQQAEVSEVSGRSEEPRQARLTLDEFLIEDSSSPGSENISEDVDDAEDASDTGSGSARARNP